MQKLVVRPHSSFQHLLLRHSSSVLIKDAEECMQEGAGVSIEAYLVYKELMNASLIVTRCGFLF